MITKKLVKSESCYYYCTIIFIIIIIIIITIIIIIAITTEIQTNHKKLRLTNKLNITKTTG